MRYRYNRLTDEVEPVGFQTRSDADWKPLHCENMGVDGCTKEQAQALDAKLGAPYVDYDGDMNPVFNDKSTYDKFLKSHGYVNRTSGKGHHSLSPELLKRAIERISVSSDRD